MGHHLFRDSEAVGLHAVPVGLLPLLGIPVPDRPGQVDDLLLSVDFNQVVHAGEHALVVVRNHIGAVRQGNRVLENEVLLPLEAVDEALFLRGLLLGHEAAERYAVRRKPVELPVVVEENVLIVEVVLQLGRAPGKGARLRPQVKVDVTARIDAGRIKALYDFPRVVCMAVPHEKADCFSIRHLKKCPLQNIPLYDPGPPSGSGIRKFLILYRKEAYF